MSTWAIPSYAEWAVPGYTEERLIGHGVSGRVVAAVSDTTGQRVAIKYLDESLVHDPDFLWQLHSGFEQLRSLDAPHVVRLYDFVEQPGEGAAIVMEQVEGVSLREMIARRGPLGAAAALVVLKDSLIALAAAHSRRLPHCDIKPENVLIDAGGWCTLTDFGVVMKADKHMSAAGTPPYMAPELWNGAPNVPATDVYATAAVLYESLAGKPPFSGRPGQLRRQHESAPPPLDRFDPPLRDFIGWGLAKYPEERPQSARAFLAELDGLAQATYGPYWEDEGRRELAERAGELIPLLAAGGGGSATVTRRARRKVLAFISVGTAAVVVLGGAGLAVLLKHSASSTQLTSNVDSSATSAQVTATPPVVASKCTTPTTFTFSGTITSTETGTLTYQWVYSSGKPGPVETMNFTSPGNLNVKGGTVTAKKAISGWAEIKIISPAQTSNRATYQLLCGAGNGVEFPSAVVTPGVDSVPCTGAAPTLTASGKIVSEKKGPVSYYWALSNGQRSAAQTLTFAAAGKTMAVKPMTFTPAALPASGSAVLVVTSPEVAASTPGTYSVTCSTVPVASASARATSPSAVKTTAKASASASKTTAAPTTAAATTAAPTTATPTTATPTTATPTTATPTTATPTTAAPTTAAPTTAAPTTAAATNAGG
jgi:serine/threonine-protein kinase